MVFSLIGASSSCILTYTFPGYMDANYGYNGSEPHAWFWRRCSQAFWVFGILSGIFSTIVIIDTSFF